MTTPPDHIDFSLLPNDDQNPKREREATDAVKAAIIARAKQHGITVHEDPGAIEPDAKENPERARKIEDEVKPKLIESTAAFRRASVVKEKFRKDGSIIEREVISIVEGRAKLDSSLSELNELADKCLDPVGRVIEIACKVANWVRERVPTRRR